MPDLLRQIYLDNNATTACDPRVVEAMLPYFTELYGNPSNGLHRMGRRVASDLGKARSQVAQVIRAHPREIIFTGGATEANNLALLGYCRKHVTQSRKKLITCAVEHKAILNVALQLECEGFEICVLPATHNGIVDMDALQKALNEQTLLVSIQAVNNELGTIQPYQQIGAMAHAVGAAYHCDASQAIGKIVIDVASNGIDLLSLSAHKFYGPKGVGALFIRGGSGRQPLSPLLFGGGQENQLRPGTENVPSIIGMGKAAELVFAEMESEAARIGAYRDSFEQLLIAAIPGLVINGKEADRIANTSSLTFPGVDADALILNVPSLCLGTGSACNAGAIEPSYVLTAIGIDRVKANSTLRVGFGRFTTPDEVVDAAELLIEAYKKVTSGGWK